MVFLTRLLARAPYAPRVQHAGLSYLKHSPAGPEAFHKRATSSPPASAGIGRTLVLCFDGTANAFDDDNTNVVHFFKLLRRDTDEQLCYYQPGIGTYVQPGPLWWIWGEVVKILDQAFAWRLYEHVHGGYQFLMENYRAGDRICLFGFSRGAYVARALAGMLHKVGLLCKGNDEHLPFAYDLYKRNDAKMNKRSERFKVTFGTPVTVEFVGAWDTVSSVGMFYRKQLPFTSACDNIKVFRHALALDERRVMFKPNLFNMPGQDSQESSASAAQRSTTDVLEVWFPGCHGDVGGGSVLDSETYSLANISLRWMVREALKARCGILFNKERLDEIGVHSVSPGVQRTLDDRDAWADIHDELGPCASWTTAAHWILWRLLELRSRSKWFTLEPHLGRGRRIPGRNPTFHQSVRRRMILLGYKPCATWNGEPRYVD